MDILLPTESIIGILKPRSIGLDAIFLKEFGTMIEDLSVLKLSQPTPLLMLVQIKEIPNLKQLTKFDCLSSIQIKIFDSTGDAVLCLWGAQINMARMLQVGMFVAIYNAFVDPTYFEPGQVLVEITNDSIMFIVDDEAIVDKQVVISNRPRFSLLKGGYEGSVCGRMVKLEAVGSGDDCGLVMIVTVQDETGFFAVQIHGQGSRWDMKSLELGDCIYISKVKSVTLVNNIPTAWISNDAAITNSIDSFK